VFIYVNLCVYFIAKLLKLQNTRSFIFLKLPKHQQFDELMKRSVVHNIFIAKSLKMQNTRSFIFLKLPKHQQVDGLMKRSVVQKFLPQSF